MSNQEYLLGNLLVKKKLIDFSQLSKAVEYQSKLNPKDFLPIGEILVKLDFISPEDLEEVLKEQKILRSGITNTSKNNSSVISNNKSNIDNSEKVFQSAQIQNIALNKPKASVSMSFINKSQKFLESRVKSMEQPPPPPLRNDTISLNNKTYDVTNPVNKAVIQTKVMPEKPKPFKTTLEKENADLKIKVTEIASKMGLLSKDELFKIIKQSQSVGSKDTSVGELLVQHGFITKDQLEEILKNIK